MARGSTSHRKEDGVEDRDPAVMERMRLKALAFSNNILSGNRAVNYSPLAPSKTVIKHHGKDIIRKSQRKNRFLFSFPGLLAPVGGATIGALKDLGTKNPILYLDFPQGQMKLLGTIFYPKNRYLTLHFSKGGKQVLCEDYFDNMIVFSDARWVGKREENGEEVNIDFPELLDEQEADFNFSGGAGEPPIANPTICRSNRRYVEENPCSSDTEGGLSEDDYNLRSSEDAARIRHSARTAGKAYKFAEVSSSDESAQTDYANESSENDEADKTCTLHPADQAPMPKSHGPLVQATLSSLFKKACTEEKGTGSDDPKRKA